ncbi:unnamed protein product, partial [Meganyctiphanes norvegica]
MVFFYIEAKYCLNNARAKEKSKHREKILFFGSSLTTTFMSVSTLTSVVPFSCFTDARATACTGKKKRKRSLIKLGEGHLDSDLQLDPSQLTQQLEKEVDLSDDASGKLLFTVWRTSHTTKTFTSFS